MYFFFDLKVMKTLTFISVFDILNNNNLKKKLGRNSWLQGGGIGIHMETLTMLISKREQNKRPGQLRDRGLAAAIFQCSEKLISKHAGSTPAPVIMSRKPIKKKKQCRGPCKRTLEIGPENFRKDIKMRDGYVNTCKKCEGIKKTRILDYVPFFSQDLLALCKYNGFKEVHKLGIFYGVLIHLRKNEWLAFSITSYESRGSKVFNSELLARNWLYNMMIVAGEKTAVGLAKQGRSEF